MCNFSFHDQAFDLKRDLPLYLSVLRGAWAYHAVVVLVFATTLAVYPAVTVLVEPSSAGRDTILTQCAVIIEQFVT